MESGEPPENKASTNDAVEQVKEPEAPKSRRRRRYNYTDFYYNATPKMKSMCNKRTETKATYINNDSCMPSHHEAEEQEKGNVHSPKVINPDPLEEPSESVAMKIDSMNVTVQQSEHLKESNIEPCYKVCLTNEDLPLQQDLDRSQSEDNVRDTDMVGTSIFDKHRDLKGIAREDVEWDTEATVSSVCKKQPLVGQEPNIPSAQQFECQPETLMEPSGNTWTATEVVQQHIEIAEESPIQELKQYQEERPTGENIESKEIDAIETSAVSLKSPHHSDELNPTFSFTPKHFLEPRAFTPYHSPEEKTLTIWKPTRSNETTLSIWKPQEEPDLHKEVVPGSDDGTVVRFGDDDSCMKSSSHDSIGKGSSHGSTCSMSDLESQDDDQSYKPPGGNDLLIHIYFKTWTIATIILLLINCANMNWVYLFRNESWWMICLSVIFFCIQGILQWSVLELPLMSLASALVKSETDRVADGSHLTILINYNLLASYKSEVDATLVNAFSAYIGNLSPTVASVLVSATGDEELKEYELLVRDNLREQIFELVVTEGKAWASGKIHDEGRARRVFEPFRDPRTGLIDENFVQLILPSLAIKYAKDFMVIQRVTRVLRKCGQYQDLMLLSEGDNSAWTYTDKEYYKEAAREYGEPLFQISEDVENIQGRRFDYTLVLDSDTGVVKNSIETLLSVAAANPERAILQPAIKIVAKDDQSLFMHIDKMRQEINEPITAALTTLLGRSGFYGKGLIQNKYYIKALLGTRENPIEKVPIDVLSHDTFEAGALSPLYVSCVQLLEEPCGNYVTWDIRECRWNRGELLLAHYFFPRSLGRLFEWMMCRVRKTPPTKLILRHETQLDDAGAYIAHSALRQMMLKPLLLLYIVCRVWVKVYFFFNWLPLALMVVLVLIIPKIPLTNRRNWHKILADILCCVLQYSPEPITGTIRVFKSARAHICGVSGWVPQFKVEQDFLIQPAVVATFAYQWRLFLLTCASLTPIIIFRPGDYLLIFLFAVTAFIPIYTTLTALPYSTWKRTFRRIQFYLCCKCIAKNRERRKQQMLSKQRHPRGHSSLPLYQSRSDDSSKSSQLSYKSRSNASRAESNVDDRSYSDQSSCFSGSGPSYDDRSYASRSSSWSKSYSQRNDQNHDHSHSSGSVSHFSNAARRYQRTSQHYA